MIPNGFGKRMRKLRKSIFLILVGIITLIFVLNDHFSKNSYEEIGRNYIESKGYTVLEYKGNIEKYILSVDKLTDVTPYILVWSVQENSPLLFLNKEISVEKFIIKGHPLDQWSSGHISSIGETEVRLFFSEKKVIGGISAPIVKNNATIVSGTFSFEGKTFNEIHSISFEEWRENILKEVDK